MAYKSRWVGVHDIWKKSFQSWTTKRFLGNIHVLVHTLKKNTVWGAEVRNHFGRSYCTVEGQHALNTCYLPRYAATNHQQQQYDRQYRISTRIVTISWFSIRGGRCHLACLCGCKSHQGPLIFVMPISEFHIHLHQSKMKPPHDSCRWQYQSHLSFSFFLCTHI